jgi:hypothetical protein
MFTHVITRAYRDTSGTPITSTESIVANTEGNYDDSVADGQTVFEVDLVLTRSLLKSLSIYSDHVVTIKTNGTGSLGAIAGSSINAAGTGYAVGDTGTIAGGTGGTYLVTGVSGAGGVTAYTVSVAGSAYSKTTGAATATGGSQAGSGTNFTLNIDRVVESIALAAQQNLIWSLANDGLSKLPFTCDITKFYVANASGASAHIQVRSLSDVTP